MFNICLPLPPNNNCLPASCFFLEPSCSWLAFHFTLGVPPPLVTQVFPLLGHPSCPPSFPHPSLTSRWNPSGSRRLFPHLPTPPIPGKGGVLISLCLDAGLRTLNPQMPRLTHCLVRGRSGISCPAPSTFLGCAGCTRASHSLSCDLASRQRPFLLYPTSVAVGDAHILPSPFPSTILVLGACLSANSYPSDLLQALLVMS